MIQIHNDQNMGINNITTSQPDVIRNKKGRTTMKKLGFILILAACLTLLCITGAVADIPASGNCGYNASTNEYLLSNAQFTYDSTTETMTITGTGAIKLEHYDIVHDTDRKNVSHIIIKDGITAIGDWCFGSWENVESVTLPSTLTEIGEYAFSYMKSWEGSLVIPEGVTKIGDSAFSGCSSLESISIPSTVKTIGQSAFNSCSSWEGKAVIPEGITKIGSYTFGNCGKLESITIPSSVKTIGEGAFNCCSAWEGKVVIPEGVTRIESYTFSSCNKLEEIVIPSTVKKIDNNAFNSCSSWEGKAIIPEGVTEISERAFESCSKLEEISIPSTVTKIGAGAFRYCSSLTGTWVIPDNVVNIQAGAFAGCYQLTALQFPANLSVLKSAIDSQYDTCPPVLAAMDSALGKLVIKNGYSVRQPGTKYNLKATYSGDTMTSLTVTGADKDCASVVLPEGVTAIAENAFNMCEDLKAVSLPKSLKSIGDYAFTVNYYYDGKNNIIKGLTDVFYAGTQSEKNAIQFNSDNNDAIAKAVWHYGEKAPADLTDLWTVTYEWDFSNPSQGKLRAKAVCKNDPNHVIEESVNAWYNVDTERNPQHKSPTCTEDGLVDVNSDGNFQNRCFIQQNQTDVIVPALGHVYNVTADNQPQYAWAIDYSKGFASLHCNRCWHDSNNLIEEATTTSSVQDGKKTYTAEFKDPRFEKQTIQVVAGRDITPPQLTKVTLASKKLSKPGILYVTLDFVEDESGLQSCWINTSPKGKTSWNGSGGESWESDPPFTGTITLEVPIDTRFPSGEHYINSIQLEDTKGNRVNYNVDTWYYSPTGDYDMTKLVARDEGGTYAVIASVPIDNGFEVTEDSDADFEYLITAPKLMDEVKNLRKDGQGVILFNYNQHVAPKALFEAMKEKDATFTFSNNEIQWQWKGTDIKEECKDVDLAVSSWTAPASSVGIEGDEDVLVIEFADNGKLPGPVKIRIKSDYYFKINGLNRAAYLYFKNGNELFNQESGVEAVLDKGDHWCEFTIAHNSTYIISANKAMNAGEDPNNQLTPQDLVRSFVSRCYKLILNRDADESGLTGWSDALISKTAAAAQIINGFVSSPEFINRGLGNAEAVDILYKTMLDRPADEGGKAGWVDALSKGYTLQHIINGFCGSAEFSALCKDYGIEPGTVEAPAPVNANTPRGKIEAFVKRCYQLILNRGADEGGLKGWSDALEGKIAAAAQIINGFVCSPEYINRNLSSEQSVTILYKTMLDRDPDEGGKAGWVDALGKGYTLQHIINGFCGSAEFTKICSDYGIEAGSVAVPTQSAAALEAQKLPDERIGNAVSADEAGHTAVNGYEPAEVEAFVKHAYRAALGREADEAGLAGWTEQIVSGAVTPKAFLRTLLFSDEQIARKLNNEQFIEMLYRLYLNRGMDDAAADRIAQLAAGGLEEVIKGFESSAEFRLVLNGFGL